MVSLPGEAEERSDIKEAGLFKFVMNVKFVGTLLMCELLPLVDRLLRTLQTSSLHVDLVQGLVKSCIMTLETHGTIETKDNGSCVSHAVQVTVAEESEEWLHSTKKAFNKLVEYVKDRFQDHTPYWPVILLCLPVAATKTWCVPME